MEIELFFVYGCFARRITESVSFCKLSVKIDINRKFSRWSKLSLLCPLGVGISNSIQHLLCFKRVHSRNPCRGLKTTGVEFWECCCTRSALKREANTREEEKGPSTKLEAKKRFKKLKDFRCS